MKRKPKIIIRAIAIFLSLILTTSCDEAPVSLEDDIPPKLTLKQSSFNVLPGWEKDNISAVAPAFAKSCTRILKHSASKAFGPLKESGTYGDWQPLCQRFFTLDHKNEAALRDFFTENFTPHQILAQYHHKTPQDERQNETTDYISYGLFTGYYEAALKGSRTKSGAYIHPLYTRPDDLIMVQLGDFREDLKGRRIAGRVHDGRLKPYEDRTDIVAGNWPHNDKTLLWVDNAIDAFFVQIQGSGLVELNDGTTMRIGYAGQNGHPYYAIGRELIKRGHLTVETVSMQTIREWLTLNPYEADEIMNSNASYVFFRSLETDGPIGGEGVALTAGRSLAIDHSLLSYGMPIWLALSPPTKGDNTAPPWQRLMITQDTGGAIRGPIRGDIFWGHGQQAEYYAGHMKRQGQYWVLLPNQKSQTW